MSLLPSLVLVSDSEDIVPSGEDTDDNSGESVRVFGCCNFGGMIKQPHAPIIRLIGNANIETFERVHVSLCYVYRSKRRIFEHVHVLKSYFFSLDDWYV